MTSFVMVSVIQMIYLVSSQPFTKSVNLQVEFLNEGSIFVCAIMVLTIMNPNNSTEQNLFIGWALIYALSINVVGNLAFVAYQTTSSLF